MKTNDIPSQHQIVLKDGRNRIASWAGSQENTPTVGDRIAIPQDIANQHAGYGSHAIVSRVEIDGSNGGLIIDVEAEGAGASATRPVVTLNSSLIPEAHRAAIEEKVRASLKLPVIEWEDNFEAQPVLRLHHLDARGGISREQLNAEVRSSLNGLLETALL